MVLAIAFALVASLLSGCGGSDSEQATASPPLPKKEFLKQGNALCDGFLEKRDSQVVRASKEHLAEYKRLPKAGQERLMGEVALEVDLPIYRELIQELGELTPPAGDEATVDKILSNYEDLLDRLFEHPEDLKEAEPLAPNAEATAYGWISCSL